MSDFPPAATPAATPTRAPDPTEVLPLFPTPETPAEPAPDQGRTPARTPARTSARTPGVRAGQHPALVVLAGVAALAVAFIIMVFVNVTSASITALAVIATAIATMVAGYYGITLSIQQVRNERAEKETALARAYASEAASRETDVWAAQLEAGLRVAMVKLNAAGVDTDEVTRAAGTPDGFF